MSSDGGDGPLYVPDAPHRPGDEADFTEWPWSPGDLGVPEIDCDASETTDLAEGLVRVLGDDNIKSSLTKIQKFQYFLMKQPMETKMLLLNQK